MEICKGIWRKSQMCPKNMGSSGWVAELKELYCFAFLNNSVHWKLISKNKQTKTIHFIFSEWGIEPTKKNILNSFCWPLCLPPTCSFCPETRHFTYANPGLNPRWIFVHSQDLTCWSSLWDAFFWVLGRILCWLRSSPPASLPSTLSAQLTELLHVLRLPFSPV